MQTDHFFPIRRPDLVILNKKKKKKKEKRTCGIVDFAVSGGPQTKSQIKRKDR